MKKSLLYAGLAAGIMTAACSGNGASNLIPSASLPSSLNFTCFDGTRPPGVGRHGDSKRSH